MQSMRPHIGPPNLGAVKGRQIRRSIFINVFLAFLCHLDYSSIITKLARHLELVEFRFNRHDHIALFLVIVVMLNLPLHSF